MKKINIIYVDDNESLFAPFNEVISKFDEINCLGLFSNAIDALDFIKVHYQEIDILFSDIEMPHKNGIWLANQIEEYNISIVFLTSYAGYALNAFEVFALQYIIKPITSIRLDEVIHHWKKIKYSSQQPLQINDIESTLTNKDVAPERIFINVIGKILLIKTKELMYIESVENYTNFVLANGNRHLSSRHLKIYADALVNHPNFVRIHRSSLINKEYVSHVERAVGKTYVVMQNEQAFEISNFKKEEILLKLL